MSRMLTALLLFVSTAQAEVAVITNLKNEIPDPSRREVQDIFLGRLRTYRDGRLALPIDQSTPLRADFYQLLTSRSIELIDAYWARLVFTGQATQPVQLPGDEAVLKTVREHEGAIGYVEPFHVDKSVRLLLLLKP